MSMVDGFPYKEEVGGSNPSVPTIYYFSGKRFLPSAGRPSIVRQGTMDIDESLFKLLTFRVWMRSRSSVG